MLTAKITKFFCYAVIGFFLAIFIFNCAAKKLPIWGSAETGFMLSYRSNIGDVFVYDRTMESTNMFEQSGQFRRHGQLQHDPRLIVEPVNQRLRVKKRDRPNHPSSPAIRLIGLGTACGHLAASSSQFRRL